MDTPVPTDTPLPTSTPVPTPAPTATLTSTPTPSLDREPLISLYRATDGPNWTRNLNWLSERPIRQWHGVRVDGRGRVTELILPDNGLIGKIPPELGELTHLERLDLAMNRLSGEIPVELGSLSNLQELALFKNQLRGAVPPELGRLSNLLNLRLDFNRLSGELPPELSMLSKLTGFEILENQLRGEVPSELVELKRLRTLFLSRNPGLTGCMPDDLLDVQNNDFEHIGLQPCDAMERGVLAELFEAANGDNWTNSNGWLSDAPLGQWHGVSTGPYGRVVALDLSENGVSGEIPTGLGRLSRLDRVGFGGNQITGCVPLALLAIPDNDFDVLAVPECGVNVPDFYVRTALLDALGKDPGSEISLGDMKSLTTLDLVPYGFRSLEGLQYAENLVSLTLGVSYSPPGPDQDSFTNRIRDLSPLSNLKGLTVLNLARAGARDLSPLAGLTRIEHLDVGYNGVNDLSAVAGLPRLETLIAPDNNIHDLTDLHSARTLKQLDLSDNLITDASPLAGLTNLERLNISHNDVVDLSAMDHLTSLTRLEASNVGIVEIPPPHVLSNLEYLDIGWNEVADLSPLSGLDGLETLKVGPADLSGVEGISLPRSLRHLQVAGAKIPDLSLVKGLSGLRGLAVPNNRIADLSAISDLENLEYLDLSFNEVQDLTSLSELTNLRHVVVVGNPVAGIGPLAENPGFAVGARLEADEDLFERASLSVDYQALDGKGVELAVGEIAFTAYSQSAIFNENVFILPFVDGLTSFDLSLPKIVTSFYAEMDDVFDFVMIVSNLRPRGDRTRTYTGKFSGVSNHVEGIGLDPYVDEKWGSAGKLQGMLHFPANDAIRSGPVLHELMHNWANHVVEPNGHWGFSSVNGLVGGFDMKDLKYLGDNRYTAGFFGPGGLGFSGKPFSMLELYLAGLATPDEVPDWIAGVDARFAMDANGVVERYEDGNVIFTAAEFIPYSIDYVIDRHGPREPGFESSQKEFRAALILLIDEDHPAMTEALLALSADVEKLSRPGADDDDGYFNFFEATLGRADLVMDGLSEFRLE